MYVGVPVRPPDDALTSWSIERAAGEADLDRIAALEAASFSNPWTREMLARELQRTDVTRMYVLRSPDLGIIGFCTCWLILDEVHINSLAIDHTMRQKGLATMLLGHVLDDVAASGAAQATLEVRRSNVAALALYERLGFLVVAQRRGYYSKPDEDGLILWCHDLRGRAVAPPLP